MRFLLTFAAGLIIGRNWNKIKKGLVPLVGDAAAQFDAMYAQAAQKVGQKVESIEDRIAERRFHAVERSDS